MFRSNVLVCGGTGCTSSNSEKIIEKLHEEINAKGLEKEVNVVRTGCFGLCALGPIMIVYPEGAFYSMVTPEDVPEAHLDAHGRAAEADDEQHLKDQHGKVDAGKGRDVFHIAVADEFVDGVPLEQRVRNVDGCAQKLCGDQKDQISLIRP